MDAAQPIIVNLTSGATTLPPGLEISSKPYPWAIGFAALSLLVAIIITPPMFWHIRNRNVGATVLVALAIYANLQSFVNAIIWSNDNIPNWYYGIGLCDIEVNLVLAAQVAFPASLACILKALARVLDTDNAVLAKTKRQQRRAHAVDLLCCVFVPLLQVPLHYIVAGWRYYIFGIAGCSPASDSSWLSIVLLIVPPFLWTLVDVYYSVLILIRLVKYRVTFDSILAHSNTSKSRFMRLYLLCIVCVLGWFPVEIYILYVNAVTSLGSFSWSRAHDPAFTHSAILVPSGGQLFYDRYIWLVGGLIIFFFFGFGKEAVKMYRDTLLSLGLGRIFPSLHTADLGRPSHTATSGTSRSKLQLLLSKGKASMASGWASTSSDTTSTPMSTYRQDGFPQRTTSLGKPPSLQSSPSAHSQFQSLATANKPSPMTSPYRAPGSQNVVVTKEVRQTSEVDSSLTSRDR